MSANLSEAASAAANVQTQKAGHGLHKAGAAGGGAEKGQGPEKGNDSAKSALAKSDTVEISQEARELAAENESAVAPDSAGTGESNASSKSALSQLF